MLYNNPSMSGHPYAPEPGKGNDKGGPEEKGTVERALDCVSTSSSSSCSSSLRSSRSSSLSASEERGDNAGGRVHHRYHRHRRADDAGSEGSQGLWASGGSLCNCAQHNSRSSSGATQEAAASLAQEPFLQDASVSSVPVSRTVNSVARNGSHFFRGHLQELSPAAAVVAATYVDPHAMVRSTSDDHVYNPPRREPLAAALPRPQTPPRGRPHTPSPLPPRPRTSSAGGTASNAVGNASVPQKPPPSLHPAAPSGFMKSPSKFVDFNPSTTAASAAAVHPYHVCSEGAGSAPSPSLHQRQSSVSSNHSAFGSGQSTPLAPPKPPRHPSEERSGMAAIWVDIPPSPVAPFVPTHLESQQRRRTPRRGSAPPSPVTSTLAASVHSVNSGLSSPTGATPMNASNQYSQQLQEVATSAHRQELFPSRTPHTEDDFGEYSCPPPARERVPLTSPTSASVSSASPEVSPSSLLIGNTKRTSGDAAAAAPTAAGPESAFPSSPPPSPARRADSESSLSAASPPGSYRFTSLRIDVPPPSSPLWQSKWPADILLKVNVEDPSTPSPTAQGACRGQQQDQPAVEAVASRRTSTSSPSFSGSLHNLDTSPHNRVALPPPPSTGQHGLYTKSSSAVTTLTVRGGVTTSHRDDRSSTAVQVALPPPRVDPGLPANFGSGCIASTAATYQQPEQTQEQRATVKQTTITAHISSNRNDSGDGNYTPRYTEPPATTRPAPEEVVDAGTLTTVVVSPQSPATMQDWTTAGPAAEEDVVSSASEGDAEAPSGGKSEEVTLRQLMDAVQRAKNRAATR